MFETDQPEPSVLQGSAGDFAVARTPRAAAAKSASQHLSEFPTTLSRVLATGQLQLTGAMILGVLAPTLIRWPARAAWPYWAGLQMPETHVQNGAMGCTFAICVGFVLLRQIKTHPGVNSIGYAIYAYTASYAGTLVAFLLLRAEYARYQLIFSYLFVVAWFLFLQRQIARQRVVEYAITPYAADAALPPRKTISWSYLRDHGADLSAYEAIITDLSAPHSPEWERALTMGALSGRPVFDIRTVREQLTGRAPIIQFADNTLTSTLHGLLYVKVKRFIDIALCLALAPAFAAVIAVAGVAIKLEDGGSVFFKQRRIGYGGRPFVLYKLRSMRENTAGSAFTTAKDHRITRVGGFIRKYRIDELPQIVNILRGEMSWIGPRPESVDLAEFYERQIPLYQFRHTVRPGISGWAQVNQGNVGEHEAAKEKLEYDFYYIKNLSPWLDILIVAKTIVTIITGREYIS